MTDLESTDAPTQLRALALSDAAAGAYGRDLRRAADEIERLRAENRALKVEAENLLSRRPTMSKEV